MLAWLGIVLGMVAGLLWGLLAIFSYRNWRLGRIPRPLTAMIVGGVAVAALVTAAVLTAFGVIEAE